MTTKDVPDVTASVENPPKRASFDVPDYPAETLVPYVRT